MGACIKYLKYFYGNLYIKILISINYQKHIVIPTIISVFHSVCNMYIVQIDHPT